MKNKFFVIISFIPLLTSCDFDDNGNASLNWFGWLLIMLFVMLMIYTGISTSETKKKTEAMMSKNGISFSEFHLIGNYVGGIPNMNDVIKNVYVRHEDNVITLYTCGVFEVDMPKPLNFSFDIDSIENITVEDKSSIEKKLTLGRIFLVGIFAFAWKKKKKEECAYLLIEWKQGRFDNTSIFSFEGKDAFLLANKSRNDLINMVESK